MDAAAPGISRSAVEFPLGLAVQSRPPTTVWQLAAKDLDRPSALSRFGRGRAQMDHGVVSAKLRLRAGRRQVGHPRVGSVIFGFDISLPAAQAGEQVH
jgi:hypothetical protein